MNSLHELDVRKAIEADRNKVRDPHRWAANLIAVMVAAAAITDVSWVSSPPAWMVVAAITWVFGKPVKDNLYNFRFRSRKDACNSNYKKYSLNKNMN